MGESIILVTNGDDWSALYVNGENVHEGHDIPSWEWVEAINKTNGFVRAAVETVKQTWLEENGLPDNYGDIPAEAWEED